MYFSAPAIAGKLAMLKLEPDSRVDVKSGDFTEMLLNMKVQQPQVTQPQCVGDYWGLEHLRERGNGVKQG